MTVNRIEDFAQMGIPYKIRESRWTDLREEHIHFPRPMPTPPTSNPLPFYATLYAWLEKNSLNDVWIWDRYFNGGIVFESKKDAMLYKLKWGG